MSLQSTDQVADLITRIRNAIMVGKNEIRVPSSKLKLAVAETLKSAGYLDQVNLEPAKPCDILHVVINPADQAAKINEITKVSKPGRRVYVGVAELPKVKSGRGLVLVSTSKGIMTGREALKARLGGEVLIKVW